MTRSPVLKSLACLLLSAAPLGQSASASPVQHWPTYANARFGYALCYPSHLLRPQPESDNGDGRVFLGAGGAQLRVWGSYNALSQTLPEAMQEDEARLASEGSTVTYRAARANWYVLSGRNRGMVFYSRRMLNGDRFASFSLHYRADAAGLWNPVAARLSRCFTQ